MFGIKIILIALAVAIFAFFLPWWGTSIAAGLVGVLMSPSAKRRFSDRSTQQSYLFWAGLIAGVIVWGGFAFAKDMGNDFLLSNRISVLIFKEKIPFAMVGVSALIGGLLAGMGAMTGSYFGQWLKNMKWPRIGRKRRR